MQFLLKFLSPEPGGNNERSGDTKNDREKNDADVNKANDADTEKDKPKKHSKLRDALQQWSNDDARDIEEDDSTPLRSGL